MYPVVPSGGTVKWICGQVPDVVCSILSHDIIGFRGLYSAYHISLQWLST